jgi:hypothetical protein
MSSPRISGSEPERVCERDRDPRLADPDSRVPFALADVERESQGVSKSTIDRNFCEI